MYKIFNLWQWKLQFEAPKYESRSQSWTSNLKSFMPNLKLNRDSWTCARITFTLTNINDTKNSIKHRTFSTAACPSWSPLNPLQFKVYFVIFYCQHVIQRPVYWLHSSTSQWPSKHTILRQIAQFHKSNGDFSNRIKYQIPQFKVLLTKMSNRISNTLKSRCKSIRYSILLTIV